MELFPHDYTLSTGEAGTEAFELPVFSPIRTITVGSGFAPDLLDPVIKQALAGFSAS
jgi:hypothetical protein